MANLLLIIETGKFCLVFFFSLVAVLQLYLGIKSALKTPPKENFYLLCVRLITDAENAETFDELDQVKFEFFTEFKKNSRHEDFKYGYSEVAAAIHNQSFLLHKKNFKK